MQFSTLETAAKVVSAAASLGTTESSTEDAPMLVSTSYAEVMLTATSTQSSTEK